MNTPISTAVTSTREKDWEAATEHAWRYFELHAGQRMTLFNYFTFFAGLMAAGIAATLQSNATFAYFGLVLGPLMVLLAFVFWKLDQRVSFLIKNAETVLAHAEAAELPTEAQLFGNEPSATAAAQANGSKLTAQWTFGTAFRTVFLAAALFGVASGGLAGLKATGFILKDKVADSAGSGAQGSGNGTRAPNADAKPQGAQGSGDSTPAPNADAKPQGAQGSGSSTTAPGAEAKPQGAQDSGSSTTAPGANAKPQVKTN